MAVAQRALKVLRLPRKRIRPSWESWDPNSDAFLHSNYGRIRTREIAASLHRTVSSVHSRAHILHLTRRTVRGPNQPWSMDDELYLLGNYGKVPRAELARHLHRTPAAIYGRASQPRWGPAAPRSSRKDWIPSEDAILRSGYGKTPIQSISHVLGRTISSIYSRAHKLGLTRSTTMARRRDWTRDEDDSLRSMYGKIRPEEIARKIGRTRPSVYHRAERLGLVSIVRSPEFLRRQSLPRTARPFPGLSNPLDIGYVAGIVDGEGSILGPRNVAVRVNMATKEVIDHLWNLCGGTVTGPYEKRSGRSEICKPQYHWTISSAENVYQLLKVLLPYLIVKRVKAEEVIRFLEKKWFS
ncbi:MAG TPA: SANT/Myb-like DNA-binding domain-containing protein [Thermoplasmata archaeon]